MIEVHLRIVLSIAVLSMVIGTVILHTTFASSMGDVVQSSKVATQENKQNQIIDRYMAEQNSKFNRDENISKTNAYSNPNFLLFDNDSGLVRLGLPSFWNDTYQSCKTDFVCTANYTEVQNNTTSLQLSTNNSTNRTWSHLYGQEIEAKPKEQYQLLTHMKLNKWAIQSHIALEGFNETSKRWYQIKQCPAGTNGPLEWQEFNCVTIIPQNTTKIRPVLNAGWSSQLGKEATTWFDSIYLIKFTGPYITDPDLKLQVLYQGLESPTSMAFLGPNDILVLEKNKGTVQRIVDGVKLVEPILDVNVAASSERGMLGITVQKNMTADNNGTDEETTYVFLYFTEAEKDNGRALGNRVYRYEFIDNKLVNPKLLLELPAGLYHNGGKILIGPDNYLYLTVGELDNKTSQAQERSTVLNYQGERAIEPDGRGGILRIDQNGGAILNDGHGILGDKVPLDKYYAYGIRNSFGIDFDPITGKLWDTENGPEYGDEINLVDPGFNSGWKVLQGIWRPSDNLINPSGDAILGQLMLNPDGLLVSLNGTGKYSPPEFIWKKTVGPTALKFLTTDKLGKQYENDIFASEVINGRIYHFKLNQNRTALLLNGSLMDKIADTDNQLQNSVFARGFGMITDLEIGPDGYLYVVSHDTGIIYKIVPGYMNKDIIRYLDTVSGSTFSKVDN